MFLRRRAWQTGSRSESPAEGRPSAWFYHAEWERPEKVKKKRRRKQKIIYKETSPTLHPQTP